MQIRSAFKIMAECSDNGLIPAVHASPALRTVCTLLNMMFLYVLSLTAVGIQALIVMLSHGVGHRLAPVMLLRRLKYLIAHSAFSFYRTIGNFGRHRMDILLALILAALSPARLPVIGIVAVPVAGCQKMTGLSHHLITAVLTFP